NFMDTSLPKTLPAFFWHFIKNQPVAFFFSQLFSFAWSLDHTLWPVVLMLVIDGLTNFSSNRAEMWHVLAMPLIFGAGLWLGVEIFFRLSGIILAKAIPKMEASVRMSMFDYIQHHSYRYFNNNMAGVISNKISDMPQSMTRILQMIMQLFLPVLLALI